VVTHREDDYDFRVAPVHDSIGGNDDLPNLRSPNFRNLPSAIRMLLQLFNSVEYPFEPTFSGRRAVGRDRSKSLLGPPLGEL
jgi:hypothetical protein